VVASGMVLAAVLGACSPGSLVASGGRSQAGAAASAGVPVTVLTPVKSGHLTPLNQVSKPYRATQTRWRDLDAQQGVHGAGPILRQEVRLVT
jgi:hypothetical protein